MSQIENNELPVSFSTLILSLASSAVMAMGLEKNPQSDAYDKDLKLAQFNIDMLSMIKDKTKNNLTSDEQGFLESVISDLQIKFVYVSQGSKS